MSAQSAFRPPRADEVGYTTRRGRATVLQKRGLREFLSRYEFPAGDDVVDWGAVFGRRAGLVAEFGFGHGEATAEWAALRPDLDHVAFEVYPPGLGALAAALTAGGLENVRIVRADAGRYAARMFEAGALTEARVFFPDPWPKRRHWKRALVNAEFAAALSARIQSGGILHVATDDEVCARRTMEILKDFPEFAFAPELGRRGRPQTRFERRAIRAGRTVRDMVWRRKRGNAVCACVNSSPDETGG